MINLINGIIAYMQNDNYTKMLLEEMNSKFDAILEAVEPIGKLQHDVAYLKDKEQQNTGDIKIIKAAVTDISNHLNSHESKHLSLEPKKV